MSSRVFTCSTSLVLAVLLALAPVARAAAPGHFDQDEIDRRYEKLVEAEKARISRENFVERLVSGLAALSIGLYGFYNDDRGLLTKVVYSAMQTAGVVMVSGAILDANQPSLLLLTDRYLNRRKEMDLTRFKRGIVLIEQKRSLGEYKQLAYTSAILAGLYGYNGYRQHGGDAALKNVFYFLSFNFTLISAANFYRLATHDLPPETTAGNGTGWHVAVLPLPSISLYF